MDGELGGETDATGQRALSVGAGSGGFTEGPVGRHLLRLGSYMAMGSVSMNASMFAEAFYLGLIGTQALAAMGVAFPVTITLFAFAGGIGTGASSVTARTMGAGNREAAALLITHSQLLALGIGIVLGVLGVIFARDLITVIGATGELRDLTTEYLTVYLLGFPAFMLSIVGSTLLRATGNARSPGIIMAAGSILPDRAGPAADFRLVRHTGFGNRRRGLGLRHFSHPGNGPLRRPADARTHGALVARRNLRFVAPHHARRRAGGRQRIGHAGQHAGDHAHADRSRRGGRGRLQRGLPGRDLGAHDPVVGIVLGGAVRRPELGREILRPGQTGAVPDPPFRGWSGE